ncbi:hypothetical protein EDP1_3988 [Pseudomonas putida S610]|nr:hypothetical protein EDP1_3988 [Pseudomonas putida S610]
MQLAEILSSGWLNSSRSSCTMRRSTAVWPCSSTLPTWASTLKATWRSKKRGSNGRALSNSAVCRASSLTASRPCADTAKDATT